LKKSQQFIIVLSGRILEGFDPEATTLALARLLRIEGKSAAKLLGGKPIELRQRFDRERIQSVRKKLTSLGVECRIVLVKEPEEALSDTNKSGLEEHGITPTPDRKQKKNEECSTKQQASNEKIDETGWKAMLARQPLPLKLASICLMLIAVFSFLLSFTYDHVTLRITITFMLFTVVLPLVITWMLFRAFRIGWLLGIIYLSFNFHSSVEYALASHGGSTVSTITSIGIAIAFFCLLLPSVLRLLEFDILERLMNRTHTLVHQFIPFTIFLAMSLTLNPSENEIYIHQASAIVTQGMFDVQTGITLHYTPYANEWPTGESLPMDGSLMIENAFFRDGNIIEAHYKDSPVLHGAVMQMKFSPDGQLLSCITDTIPGKLIGPRCSNCVCGAHSSTMVVK
jgi:hypothetical protein